MMTAPSLALVMAHVTDTRAPLAQVAPFNALIELSDAGDASLSELLEATLADAMGDGLITDAMLSVSEAQTQALTCRSLGVNDGT